MNHEKVEALSWLQSNPNPYPFAGNRFENKAEAIEFVKELYNLGCKTVYVTGILDEDWRIRREGGPYADTLLAEVPEGGCGLKSILGIYNEEALLDNFEEADVFEDYQTAGLRFWWD